jgi:two-component system NtrC family response regulator
MSRLLIIDDEEQSRQMLKTLLGREGYTTAVARDCRTGWAAMEQEEFEVVLLDVNLPDGSGLDLLPQIRERSSPPEVIIITGRGDRHGAELAIKYGAWDYFQKGDALAGLKLSVRRALEHRELSLASGGDAYFHAPDLIGSAPAFQSAVRAAAQAARSDASVLITGETGTGKEILASAIHNNSSRSRGPFIVVDCAALPDTLVGSVLFGHVRGAFTGASDEHSGLIAQANGGTLFLDELGEMPLDVQKSFLRVLQDQRYRPVGSNQMRQSNFRVIAATNRDLEKEAQEGSFRQDLLFRLRALTVALPPLRKRMEDIPLLTSYMVTHHCTALGSDIIGINEGFIQTLKAYEWPGNVRELSQAIISAVAQAGDEPVLFATHLPTHIRASVIQAQIEECRPQQPPAVEGAIVEAVFSGGLETLRDMRTRFEDAYLRQLVHDCEGSIDRACDISGLSRPHVYALLKKHRLSLQS